MKPIAVALLLHIFLLTTFTQTPSPTPPDVVVHQSYIDEATDAFKEVKALRDLVMKYETSERLSIVERAAADATIKGLNDLLAIKDRTIDQYEKLVKGLQQIIDFQYMIIDRLQKMLNKPTTFWQKLLNTVKEMAKAAAFILIGMGIAQNVIFDELPYPDVRRRERERWTQIAYLFAPTISAF